MCWILSSLCRSPSPGLPAAPETTIAAVAIAAATTNARHGTLERRFLIVLPPSPKGRDDEGVFPLRPGANRVVHPPLRTQGLADLAHSAVHAQRLAHRRQEIRLAARGVANGVERPRGLGRVPLCPDAGRPLELAPLRLRIEPVQLDGFRLVLLEAVDADDHAFAALDRSLPLEGRLFDLRLDEAPLDRLDGATQLVDARDQVRRARLEVVRQGLDEVRAAERVSSVGRAALRGENLLCAKGELRGMLGRQGECLVERVRVQRLRAAADG